MEGLKRVHPQNDLIIQKQRGQLTQHSINLNEAAAARSLKIKYYASTYIFAQMFFLSSIASGNFLGDYDNYASNPDIESQKSSEISESKSILDVTRVMLSFSLILIIMTGVELYAVLYLSKKLLNYILIGTGALYSIRFVIGFSFLKHSFSEVIYEYKTRLDTEIVNNDIFCVEAYDNILLLCRHVYSFNFLYIFEIILMVVVPLVFIALVWLSGQQQNRIQLLETKKKEAEAKYMKARIDLQSKQQQTNQLSGWSEKDQINYNSNTEIQSNFQNSNQKSLQGSVVAYRVQDKLKV